MTSAPVFPPIAELLPHRDTMLLLDRVVASDGESLTAALRVPPGAWYSDEKGNMPAWIGIELMAQAIAAHVALEALSQSKLPKQGVLLGTKAYRSDAPSFPAGAELLIAVHLLFRDESGLGAYDASIALEGKELAAATIKVFEPPNFEAFIQESMS